MTMEEGEGGLSIVMKFKLLIRVRLMSKANAL